MEGEVVLRFNGFTKPDDVMRALTRLVTQQIQAAWHAKPEEVKVRMECREPRPEWVENAVVNNDVVRVEFDQTVDPEQIRFILAIRGFIAKLGLMCQLCRRL